MRENHTCGCCFTVQDEVWQCEGCGCFVCVDCGDFSTWNDEGLFCPDCFQREEQ